MAIQRFAWNKLRSHISNLLISYKYFIDADEERLPEDIRVTKIIPNGHKIILMVNNYSHEGWITELNLRIIDFENEINANLDSINKRESIVEYFTEIHEFMRLLDHKLKYNLDDQTWEFEFVDFTEIFKKNNLDSFFKASLQMLYHIYIERINNISQILGKNDFYKALHNRLTLSATGNKKIIWNKQINQLVDFYLNLLKAGIIETDRANLRDFIINNFTHKGNPISEKTITTYFDPNKEFEDLPKNHKKINPKDFI